jgi:hypothetical protein
MAVLEFMDRKIVIEDEESANKKKSRRRRMRDMRRAMQRQR